jgi:hypothetical protein
MSNTEAALLERINSTVSRIGGKSVELQNSINSKLGFIPEPVQSSIRQGWNDFCAFMGRIWENLQIILSNTGSPTSLSNAVTCGFPTLLGALGEHEPPGGARCVSGRASSRPAGTSGRRAMSVLSCSGLSTPWMPRWPRS